MTGVAREREERLRALWMRYLAGETSAAPELAAEIRSGSRLGLDLAADEELHRLLDALGRSNQDEQAFVEQVGRVVAAESSAERFVSAVERRIAATPRRTPAAPFAARGRARWLLMGAPVGLMAAAALALWFAMPRQSPAPDTLAGAHLPATVLSGTFRSGAGRLRPGQQVPEPTSLASDEGRACLRLAEGSRVCLERGSSLRLDPAGTDRRITLDAGKVAVTVRRQGPDRRFTVGAPAADVTALGTAFSVELADGGAAMVTRVMQGAVSIGIPAGSPSGRRTVRAHEALSATTQALWRMSSEEEREEWSLVRAHVTPAVLALQNKEPAPVDPEEHPDGATSPDDDVAALLSLADALRARGRLTDAQGICDGLARRYPGRPEIERIAAELRRPAPAQPWNATPAVYRINAGGARYLDPRGNLWSGDAHFSGGHPGEFQEEIDGTDMDPLYRSERFAFPFEKLSYSLPIANGRYVVRLHFAEIWAGTVKRNMRAFDVLLEGEKVLAGYDIAAEVGPMTATVKQAVTTVLDGSLDIDFKHQVENPKISAIEVFALTGDAAPPPVPAPPTVFPPLPLPPTDALYRVNAGGREYVDSRGRRWEADNYFNDTGLGSAQYVEIAGTDLDPLYQTERRSFVLPTRRHLVYSFPVAPGRYLLRMHFAELDRRMVVGGAVFDVLVEKTEILRRLDVFAEVGRYRALIKEVETTVTDGELDLSFRPGAGRPKIAAIELIPLTAGASANATTAAPAPPAAGCALGGPAAPTRSVPWLLLAAVALLLRRGCPAGRRDPTPFA